MKNTGRCPKCSGTEIFRVDGNVGAYGTGNNMLLGRTVFSAIPVARYICMRCGFTEEWIDPDRLAEIRQSKRARRL